VEEHALRLEAVDLLAQMRRRGYRLNAYDPDAANAPQAELFTLHMKEAA
jgi:hypothetical protein